MEKNNIEKEINFFNGKTNLQEDNKIILVTGGAGFIGSNFIRHLINKYPNFKVINFDKLTYSGNLNNLTTLEDNNNYVFVKGNVSDPKDVKTTFEQFNPDFVVHFAAESHVDKSIINPNIFLETNVLGTQIMLNYSREYKVQKFVQISTDEVYGSIQENCNVGEEGSLAPNNPYAASKASADLLLRVAYQTYGQRVNIVRACNNFGPYQFPEKFIPIIITNALQNKEIPVYGNGINVREWIHVEDHCRAIDTIMQDGKSGEIYNVGTGNKWRNIDLVEHILQKLDLKNDLISYVLDRQGHDIRYSVDSSKIRKQLNWEPQIDFETGLEQVISWYKNHLDWIEEINSGEYAAYFKEIYKPRMMDTD
ncbi:MAG: dTDP-glucose 4,6-dehydratase [Candidatus Cloacimonetes bacterium]|nr:dTDP-glucose 4,6-dehydratase [Candidatus Cloacimonadota bacterium]